LRALLAVVLEAQIGLKQSVVVVRSDPVATHRFKDFRRDKGTSRDTSTFETTRLVAHHKLLLLSSSASLHLANCILTILHSPGKSPRENTRRDGRRSLSLRHTVRLHPVSASDLAPPTKSCHPHPTLRFHLPSIHLRVSETWGYGLLQPIWPVCDRMTIRQLCQDLGSGVHR
jgi:hypothetical protein